MCGIVGLFAKSPSLEAHVGALTAQMLAVMGDRGPDSAGFAVYGADTGRLKLTLRSPDAAARDGALAALAARFGEVRPVRRDTHIVVSVPERDEIAARALLAESGVAVVGAGRRMELYKEVGRPEAVAAAFDLPAMAGTHAVGHTRMATESAVTTRGAHPFSTGPDQCLVHNGSLSNHNGVRRMLVREGIAFETENDSEVAAGYLTFRMREGASLEEALTAALADLDGFYTFLVGTRTGFAVLRDPIACKPAVMAETDDYVAFGSEFRALAGLPGIEDAHLFEPEPGRVYAWERPE
ncbi:class II glutamine amidotransferase [Acuticoccus mangrovi]|uniref:Glutamine amidotransferase family protein n=1 Tax=Acuticoccus mangrovi TaxID=2796142 RepID=A0A934IJJ6_9HYPH|nr:glutamine amidotransferase family protein [Acuticoccus mangrovi]MBJ3776176.1 glutamine amidotransferase family protein [Acuticoccus mangrovi]